MCHNDRCYEVLYEVSNYWNLQNLAKWNLVYPELEETIRDSSFHFQVAALAKTIEKKWNWLIKLQVIRKIIL